MSTIDDLMSQTSYVDTRVSSENYVHNDEKPDPDLLKKVSELMNERSEDPLKFDEDIKKNLISNISDEDFKDFKNNIFHYSEIDRLMSLLNQQLEPLKPVQDQLKLLKKQKLDLEKVIANFMKNHTITHCNLPNRAPTDAKGALAFSTATVRTVITEKFVKDRLLQFFKKDQTEFNKMTPENKVDALHKFIYKSSIKQVKPVVKRVAYVEPVNVIEKEFVGPDE